jgi:hypothetical protein
VTTEPEENTMSCSFAISGLDIFALERKLSLSGLAVGTAVVAAHTDDLPPPDPEPDPGPFPDDDLPIVHSLLTPTRPAGA